MENTTVTFKLKRMHEPCLVSWEDFIARVLHYNRYSDFELIKVV